MWMGNCWRHGVWRHFAVLGGEGACDVTSVGTFVTFLINVCRLTCTACKTTVNRFRDRNWLYFFLLLLASRYAGERGWLLRDVTSARKICILPFSFSGGGATYFELLDGEESKISRLNDADARVEITGRCSAGHRFAGHRPRYIFSFRRFNLYVISILLQLIGFRLIVRVFWLVGGWGARVIYTVC